MAKFTVVWHKTAEDSLAELWVTSLAPSIITKTANSIEEDLKVDPESVGHPLMYEVRFVRRYPLVVLFRVKPDDRLVEVLKVRLDVTAG